MCMYFRGKENTHEFRETRAKRKQLQQKELGATSGKTKLIHMTCNQECTNQGRTTKLKRNTWQMVGGAGCYTRNKREERKKRR